MPRYPLPILAIAALLISGFACAGEIYKWTDADGNVHYGDRPTGESQVERVAIASRNTNSAAVSDRVQAHDELQTSRQEARAKRAEDAQAAAKEQAEEEKRQEQCQMYRSRLEKFLQSPRLYREDEAGERVYLDDEQILEARAKVQNKIQETCN